GSLTRRARPRRGTKAIGIPTQVQRQNYWHRAPTCIRSCGSEEWPNSIHELSGLIHIESNSSCCNFAPGQGELLIPFEFDQHIGLTIRKHVQCFLSLVIPGEPVTTFPISRVLNLRHDGNRVPRNGPIDLWPAPKS